MPILLVIFWKLEEHAPVKDDCTYADYKNWIKVDLKLNKLYEILREFVDTDRFLPIKQPFATDSLKVLQKALLRGITVYSN